MRFSRACLAMLTCVVAACATVPASPPDRSFAGRFVATAVSGEHRDSVSGRFYIEIRGNQQSIDLATPVGTTLARIEIEPGRARVTDGKMQGLTGPNADELVEQALGWRLPISGLPYWLEGRADPARSSQVGRMSDGATEIEQDGWNIRVSETVEVTGHPRRLQLDRDPSPGGPKLSVRLVIDTRDTAP
jgi:outer membrane lipoprotein LolB